VCLLTLHNLALVMALSGRLAEAEVLGTRFLKILEKRYPPDDPILLRPLQSAVADSVSNSEDRKGSGDVSRLQSIPTERPRIAP